MRRVTAFFGLVFLLLPTGCNNTGWGIFSGIKKEKEVAPQGTLTTDRLVAYLNKNAERMQTLRCEDVRLTYYHGISPFNLSARLICQQPRNFRMDADFMGKPEVNFGSNSKEFWYWVRRAEPAGQFFCSYADLEAGNVKVMPFPFQPEWVMEALGMGKFGPPEKYQLVEAGEEVKLVEQSKSPQGLPVKKVIVFRRRPAKTDRGEPQIKAFLLLDGKTGQEICSAQISTAQLDKGNGALLPKTIDLRWPEQKLRLSMRLENPAANEEIPTHYPFFERRPLNGFPTYDLARLQLQLQPGSIQRVQGFAQQK